MKSRASHTVLRLFLLASAATLSGCEESPPPVIRSVLSMVVQPASQSVASFTGTVQPRYQAELGFQTIGRMTSRDVNVGDIVSKGQRLGSLDPTVARLAIVSTQADLANARAVLANTEAALERKRTLASMGSGTQVDLDAATAAYRSAQARVTQAEAGLQKAVEQLGYTTLNSGYDGVVVSWSAEIGQVVSLGQTVVTLARPDIRDGVFDIPDDRIGQFTEGASFRVSLLVQDTISARAVVREITPQSDSATRTRRIRFTIEDPPEAFRLGTTIRLVAARQQADKIEVPLSAVLKRNGRDAVWIVGPDKKAIARPITLGHESADRVVVTFGLSVGDRVIIAGVNSLLEGQSIELLQESQP